MRPSGTGSVTGRSTYDTLARGYLASLIFAMIIGVLGTLHSDLESTWRWERLVSHGAVRRSKTGTYKEQ